MSFFVSESLKGRVTEENLLDTKQGDEKLEREAVYVRVSFEKFSHEFKFISLKKEKLLKTLIIEIPQSYKFLSALLTPNSKFEVIASDGVLSQATLKEDNYEIIRQNERSCYLLKIVIGK